MNDRLRETPSFKTVAFKLLKRTFKIKCPSNEAAGFALALNVLQAELDKLDPQHRSTDREKLLVTAALNLSQQVLLHQENMLENAQAVEEKIQYLQEKLERLRMALTTVSE